MSQEWDMFLDENDNDQIQYFTRNQQNQELWNDLNNDNIGSGLNIGNQVPKNLNRVNQTLETSPASFDNFGEIGSNHFQGRFNQPASMASEYYYVRFHPNRAAFVKNNNHIPLTDGEYVVTEADRGIDIGQIIRNEKRPPEKDLYYIRNITRKATQQEILSLPEKARKEQNYVTICQQKANDLRLPMKIQSTELQFDGKKLTVYFTADKYIDFRDLVHVLFRTFGIRIWMVWFDGNEPIKDVFTHSPTERRRMTMD